MKCPGCGQENRPDRRFAGQCGASLTIACAACAFSNNPGEKFCGGCGKPLAGASAPKFADPASYTPKHLAERIINSKAALEGQRKQVTVLFADLKGSMELLADRDPEEARKILDPALELMMEAVHRYEGKSDPVSWDTELARMTVTKEAGHGDEAAEAGDSAGAVQSTKRGRAPRTMERPAEV